MVKILNALFCPFAECASNNWQTFKRILCCLVDVFNYSHKKHMLLAALQCVEWSQIREEKSVSPILCSEE